MGKQKCYLASANTAVGFVSYFDNVIKNSERVYILKGGPGCGKSTFIKKIGNDLLNYGFDVDFIYCGADSSSLDGIFVNEIQVAIVDGTAPHVIEPKYPGAIERLLDFGDFWDIDYLRKEKDNIKHYIDEIAKEYDKFYQHLKNAKNIHDRWENEYLLGMNFNKATEITNEIIHEIIRTKTNKNAIGKELHRFAGAMTPQGQLCFYENLTESIKNLYIVKGRPGTGKSTMSKKIGKSAMEAGYDVEYYHCAFDPNSIDMIIIPELNFAILDGTAPHVFDPINDDKLVDMFECIDTKIVREEDDPIKGIQIEYADEMKDAKVIYSRIKNLHDKLEKYYVDATDFNEVDALRNRITKTLKDMKKKD